MTKKKEEAPAEETVKEEAEASDTTEGGRTESDTSENASSVDLSDKFDENDEEIIEAPVNQVIDEPQSPPEEVKASLEAEYPMLGRERSAPLGHGTHDAAVSGLMTDASGSYRHPSTLKN